MKWCNWLKRYQGNAKPTVALNLFISFNSTHRANQFFKSSTNLSRRKERGERFESAAFCQFLKKESFPGKRAKLQQEMAKFCSLALRLLSSRRLGGFDQKIPSIWATQPTLISLSLLKLFPWPLVAVFNLIMAIIICEEEVEQVYMAEVGGWVRKERGQLISCIKENETHSIECEASQRSDWETSRGVGKREREKSYKTTRYLPILTDADWRQSERELSPNQRLA